MANLISKLNSNCNWMGIATFALFALFPLFANLTGQEYYVTFLTRVLIIGLAAIGLNIALGYAGMVSFGHSLYIGVGAYTVAIVSEFGISNAALQLGIAVVTGVTISLIVGLVCLRTSGVAFIMITLAFAQMFYYVVVGLKQYGGDDGMSLASRSTLGALDLENNNVFYYFCLVIVSLVIWCVYRMSKSRFGSVIRGCKLNERRMVAIGFGTLRYKLLAYVISAEVCVVAGFLLANLAKFSSPSYLHWSMSGELIVMVVLGGIGTVLGPLLGAISLLFLEEVLANFVLPLPFGFGSFIQSHWMLLIGLFIVIIGLRVQHGLAGFINRRNQDV
ncbi:MAG: branched-chain amino acid ABC transporter permease [Betaproteobacteria bacterium]|jgi:branched-chain amino acid transport system permease protein|nr:branched-chain amino acid ABC transporter permease [Betaproteobacteria bacterium]